MVAETKVTFSGQLWGKLGVKLSKILPGHWMWLSKLRKGLLTKVPDWFPTSAQCVRKKPGGYGRFYKKEKRCEQPARKTETKASDWIAAIGAAMAKPPPIVGRSAIGVAFSEGARNWPFVFGFGVTLGLVFKLTTSLDRKHAFITSSPISPHLLCYIHVLYLIQQA